MKRTLTVLLGLSLAFVVCLALSFQAAAQEKKSKSGEDRLTGRIQMLNKDTSTITLERGNVRRQVVFGADTKITHRNKPATLDQLKEGRRVIILGKFNDRAQLVASRIDIRD